MLMRAPTQPIPVAFALLIAISVKPGEPAKTQDLLVPRSNPTNMSLALAGPLGATGAILAVANVEPELCCAAFDGDAGAQRKLADVHLAARKGGPAVLKQILAQQRGVSALSRPFVSRKCCRKESAWIVLPRPMSSARIPPQLTSWR